MLPEGEENDASADRPSEELDERSAADYKREVIERIFWSRYSQEDGTLSNPVVTLREVQDAINAYNTDHQEAWNRAYATYEADLADWEREYEASRTAVRRGRPPHAPRLRRKPTKPAKLLSTRNPANFFKDITRNYERAARAWPDSVFAEHFVGRQAKGKDKRTGQGRCFVFEKVAEGVPKVRRLYDPVDAETSFTQVESVSLQLEAKRLGRDDEAWLGRVIAELRIVPTYLAIHSSKRGRIYSVQYLVGHQKLGDAEIDELFLGIEELPDGEHRRVVICCELKKQDEDIFLEQLLPQVQAAATVARKMFAKRPPRRRRRSNERAAEALETTGISILPLGIKVVGASRIRVVEFTSVELASAEACTDLMRVEEAFFELVPKVPGIGRGPLVAPGRRRAGESLV